jgi:enoyl-CoA hydratase
MTQSPPEAPEVLVRREERTGRLTLNRPPALHALTLGMCQTLTEALLAWRHEAAVDLVVIDHAGERGFCAGGDIRMLAESGALDGVAARAFFRDEYRLNHLLFGYEKPVIAIMDGVTMGGGVGVSAPARYRVATERTTFAMPETGIGLFPDVGGGWFLPRLPGKSGLWLALTGARLKAADCRALGIATHFVESGRIIALKETLQAASLAQEPDAAIAAILADFAGEAGDAPIAARRGDIDRLFSGESVEAIVAALKADGGDWAGAQLAALTTKSPQTLKVAFRQLAIGAHLTDFADNMAMEYRIGARVVQRHDFLEGVRAVIIDKDNAPRWSPATLEAVTPALLDAIFAPLAAEDEWTPLPELAR